MNYRIRALKNGECQVREDVVFVDRFGKTGTHLFYLYVWEITGGGKTILVDTGSRMDDIIFQEFKGTGNMDLVLSRKCAEQRLWPAININQSGTRKEHLLLDARELQEATRIRRQLSQLDEIAALSAFMEYLATRIN